VVGGRLDGDGDLGGARVGPQPEIDAEGVAVLGGVLEQADQPLGEPHEEFRGFRGFGERRRFRVVQDDQVDVAGVVELEGAVLAERQDDVAAAAPGLLRIEIVQSAGALGIAQQPVDGGGNARIGEAGEGRRDLVASPRRRRDRPAR
jgi:hypothetical protein